MMQKLALAATRGDVRVFSPVVTLDYQPNDGALERRDRWQVGRDIRFLAAKLQAITGKLIGLPASKGSIHPSDSLDPARICSSCESQTLTADWVGELLKDVSVSMVHAGTSERP